MYPTMKNCYVRGIFLILKEVLICIHVDMGRTFPNPIIDKIIKIHFFYRNQLLSQIPILSKNISFQFKFYPTENSYSKFKTFPKPCYLLLTSSWK